VERQGRFRDAHSQCLLPVPEVLSQSRFEIRVVYAQAFVQVLPGVQEFHGQVVERSW